LVKQIEAAYWEQKRKLTNTIVINQSHEAFDVPNYSDDKMVMLYKWAIFEAIPEYRNISIAEFGSLMSRHFNCDVLEKI
jgi:hypothetical protein